MAFLKAGERINSSCVQRITDAGHRDAKIAGRVNRRTDVSTDATEVLLLRDDHGRYYVLSRELLEQNRVPEDQVAGLKQQLTDGDVHGYLTPTGPVTPGDNLSLTFTTVGIGSLTPSPRDVAARFDPYKNFKFRV